MGRKIGFCGQAPSDYPDFARFLVGCGIDSMRSIPMRSSKRRVSSSMPRRHGRSPRRLAWNARGRIFSQDSIRLTRKNYGDNDPD